jgi:hypothetical protein
MVMRSLKRVSDWPGLRRFPGEKYWNPAEEVSRGHEDRRTGIGAGEHGVDELCRRGAGRDGLVLLGQDQ